MDANKGQTVTMPGWLDLKISLGNIATVICVLVGGGVYYARMDGRVTTNEISLAKSELIYVRKDVAELEQKALTLRLQDLKDQLDRVEKKLDGMR